MFVVNLFAVISSTGMILNAAELVALIREKKIKDPFKMVLFSLAIADFLTLAGTSIVAFAWIVSRTHIDYAFDALFPSAIISQFHIIIITLLRIVAVAFPFRCKGFITPRLSCIVLVSVWITTTSTSAVLLKFKGDLAVNIFTTILLGSGAFLLISYSFIIYRVLKDRGKVTASRAASLQNKKLIIYSMSVTLTFIVCNYPFAVRIIVNDGKNIESADRSIESLLFFLNPMIDPVIYLLVHVCKKDSNACCHLAFTNPVAEQRPVFHSSVNVEQHNGKIFENPTTNDHTVCSYISSTV